VVVVALAGGRLVSVNLMVAPAELDRAELVVEGEAYHHLFHAARAAVGDPLRLVDGLGRAREGEVTRVDRRRAVVRLGAEAPALEPRLRLELLVAPPRPSRASWLVEKGTELGVSAFRFLECERSARPLDRQALDRLRRVARAAVEQCGRSRLPEVTGGHRLEPALAPGGHDVVFVLDPGAPVALGEQAAGFTGSALVVVGPEGGFTPGELELAARLGATPMRLVESVLRLETAALAAAAWALLQPQTGAAPRSAGAWKAR
jgi:16S rRNA (uracil1498-N3)-methyltransferase